MYRVYFKYYDLDKERFEIGNYGTCFSEMMYNHIYNILINQDDIVKVWYEDEKGVIHG